MNVYPFTNTPLPYAYDALEPFIDAKTMELHHDRHLQGYINNLNKALQPYPYLQTLTLEQLIRKAGQLPCGMQTAIRNNAGGVFNHRFFFQGLTNPAKDRPEGALARNLERQFGSFEQFRDAFQQMALSVFGSGYAWLAVDRGRLCILPTANQHSPVEQCLSPILTLDVWEHAYYLKHYNLRADYIHDWFQVIDWARAETLYLRCI